MFAFWSLRAGAAAGCRCRVFLALCAWKPGRWHRWRALHGTPAQCVLPTETLLLSWVYAGKILLLLLLFPQQAPLEQDL